MEQNPKLAFGVEVGDSGSEVITEIARAIRKPGFSYVLSLRYKNCYCFDNVFLAKDRMEYQRTAEWMGL